MDTVKRIAADFEKAGHNRVNKTRVDIGAGRGNSEVT